MIDPKPVSSKRVRRDSLAREASEKFKRVVLALDRECIASGGGECSGLLQAHHVVYQFKLRDLGLAGELWNPENGAAVCERHHRRHHNRTQPLTVAQLPARCLRFVAENDLYAVFDRYYLRHAAEEGR